MRNYLQWKTCVFCIHKRTKLKINNELVVFLSTKSQESDRTFDINFKIAKEEDFSFLLSITLGPYNVVENPFQKWMLWHSARQTSPLTRALNERQSNNRKINKLFCITTEKLVLTEKISFHVYGSIALLWRNAKCTIMISNGSLSPPKK